MALPALVPIALQLAQFAPAIMRYFGAGEQNAQVADKVVEIAKAVTGQSSPEEALAAIKASTEFAHQLQMTVLSNSMELDKLYYADMADARRRDVEMRKAGFHNVRADLLTAGAFLVILVIWYYIWTKPEINEFVKGVATLVLGRFLGYMDQIFQFEFGTTRKTNGS